MSTSLDAAAVERALRKAAALRNLCLRLPRILSEREAQRVAELAAFARGDTDACSDAALRVGLREAFRRRDADLVRAVAARVPERVHADLDLATWAAWARRVGATRGEGEGRGGSAPAPPRTTEGAS